MSGIRNSILVVDDEPAQRQLLRAVLEKDYLVTSAADAAEAQQVLAARSFDLVITDQRMPGTSGIELLEWVKERFPETAVIVLTAFGTVDTAVEAMKKGAEDYLSKPVRSPDELRLTVARVLERRSLKDREILYRKTSDGEFPPDVIARSEAMKKVLELVLQVAPQTSTVLITGESGTGKEVVARLIHRHSARSAGPFVAVNCAALSENLLESELFGHEKGAFTGAVQAKRGRFELAHGGTLFLDEIGEMSALLQAKLLRVLQESQFERVGGTRTLSVDVRILAATNRDLSEAIAGGDFREDLFYRLSVFPVHIAPLRARKADILPLARHFVEKISRRMGLGPRQLSSRAEAALEGYSWPGNIRELQNAIERALIVSGADEIDVQHLPLREEERGEAAAPKSLAEVEKGAILETLERYGGDRRAAAEALGISLRTLQYRLKEYGLTR